MHRFSTSRQTGSKLSVMAAQGGAAAGPNVQHDEFMEEDDPDGGSGDEGDSARAHEPEPIK